MISKDKIEKLEEITIEDFKELMGNLISFFRIYGHYCGCKFNYCYQRKSFEF